MVIIKFEYDALVSEFKKGLSRDKGGFKLWIIQFFMDEHRLHSILSRVIDKLTNDWDTKEEILVCLKFQKKKFKNYQLRKKG